MGESFRGRDRGGIEVLKKTGAGIIMALIILLLITSVSGAPYYRDFLDDLARDFYQEGQTEATFKALQELEEKLARGEKDFQYFCSRAEIWLFRGEIMRLMGKEEAEQFFEQALFYVEEALKLGENHPAPRLLAEALSQLFNYRSPFFIIRHGQRARDYLEKAAEEDYMTLLIQANYYLNAPRIGGGDVEKGLGLFEEIEKQGHPVFNFAVYNLLAQFYREKGKEGKAEAFEEKAGAIYPENPWVGQTY